MFVCSVLLFSAENCTKHEVQCYAKRHTIGSAQSGELRSRELYSRSERHCCLDTIIFRQEIKDDSDRQNAFVGNKVFTVTKGDGTDAAVFEIWVGPKCISRLNVPDTLHGDVINDGLFSGGASWSYDESKIAYVAEVRSLFESLAVESVGR